MASRDCGRGDFDRRGARCTEAGLPNPGEASRRGPRGSSRRPGVPGASDPTHLYAPSCRTKIGTHTIFLINRPGYALRSSPIAPRPVLGGKQMHSRRPRPACAGAARRACGAGSARALVNDCVSARETKGAARVRGIKSVSKRGGGGGHGRRRGRSDRDTRSFSVGSPEK